MEYPKGFKQLVNLASKIKVKKSKDLWENYCKIIFMGKGISSAESNIIFNTLKKELDFEYISKINGEKLENKIREIMTLKRDELKTYKPRMIITNFLDRLFFNIASLKGGARFFKKKRLNEKINELSKTHKNIDKLIEDIIKDDDVPGIGYTKSIMWLHNCGYATHTVAPTFHLKKFMNNFIGPYYKYNEDDKYFMEWAQEMKKDFKGIEMIYIAKAIFLFMTAKMYAPRGSKLYPEDFLKHIKKNKLTLKKVDEGLSDIRKKDKIIEILSNI